MRQSPDWLLVHESGRSIKNGLTPVGVARLISEIGVCGTSAYWIRKRWETAMKLTISSQRILFRGIRDRLGGQAACNDKV